MGLGTWGVGTCGVGQGCGLCAEEGGGLSAAVSITAPPSVSPYHGFHSPSTRVGTGTGARGGGRCGVPPCSTVYATLPLPPVTLRDGQGSSILWAPGCHSTAAWEPRPDPLPSIACRDSALWLQAVLAMPLCTVPPPSVLPPPYICVGSTQQGRGKAGTHPSLLPFPRCCPSPMADFCPWRAVLEHRGGCRTSLASPQVHTHSRTV